MPVPLPRPVLLEQAWADAIFVHWRIPVAAAASRLPPGTEPDVFEGATWLGLIGFRVPGTRLGPVLPLPWLGSFTEVNVRLYSRDGNGRHGVVFLSLDASRLGFVLAARAARIRYVWSRCRPAAEGPAYGYDVERRRGQVASRFAVRPDFGHEAA